MTKKEKIPMSITGFASVPAKFAREQGYYCNNICFDVFVKCFLLGGVCGRDVWNKGDMLYRQKVLEFKVDRVRYTEQETAEKTTPRTSELNKINAEWLKAEIEKLEGVYECEVRTGTGIVLVEIRSLRLELKMVLRATIANLVDTKGVQIGAKYIQEHTEPRDCCC